jgi:hypothetical protein
MRDLRRYARQTNVRLFLGFFVILVFVGLGLIWIIYGTGGAVFGLVCLAAGLAPLLLIWLFLLFLEWIVKRSNPD